MCRKSETTTKQKNNEVVPLAVSIYIIYVTFYLKFQHSTFKHAHITIVNYLPSSSQSANSDIGPANLLSHEQVMRSNRTHR